MAEDTKILSSTPKKADASAGQAPQSTPTPTPVEPVVEIKEKPEPVMEEEKEEVVESLEVAEVVEVPSADANAVADKPVEKIKTESEATSLPKTSPQPAPSQERESEPALAPTSKEAKTSSDAKAVADPANDGASKPTGQTIVSAPEINSIARPIMSFLDKLKELRGRANTVRHKHVEENLKKIIEYADRTQKVTNDDVERLTGVKHRQAVNYLNTLVKDKKLMKFGSKSNTFYKPVK